MEEERKEPQPNLEANEVDHFVSAVDATLGSVPGIGPIVAALIVSAIPRQRMDRVVDMVRSLAAQVEDLSEQFKRQRMQTPEFMDQFTEGARQAADALTDERKAYIASLLKNSIKSDDLAHYETKMLLSLLGQLEGPELIILGWYGTDQVGERADAYFARHEDVVRIPYIDTGASDAERRAAVIHEQYINHLHQLGLLIRDSRGRVAISQLGRMLLEQIDLYQWEPEG